MTWLASKLDKRVGICKPLQTPSSDGGFERDYETIATVWASIKPVNISALAYIRGVQINDVITHKMVVRSCAVKHLGLTPSLGTLSPIKTEYFIFLYEPTSTRGRRFNIHNITNTDEKGEYYQLLIQEMSEEGTGY